MVFTWQIEETQLIQLSKLLGLPTEPSRTPGQLIEKIEQLLNEQVEQPGWLNFENLPLTETELQLIINIIEAQVKAETQGQLTLYWHNEFDSNQSAFEFIFNNRDLTVQAASEVEAKVIMTMLRLLINAAEGRSKKSDVQGYFEDLWTCYQEDKEDEEEEIDPQVTGLMTDFFALDLAQSAQAVDLKQLSQAMLLVIQGYSMDLSTTNSRQAVDAFPPDYDITIRQLQAKLGQPITLSSLAAYLQNLFNHLFGAQLTKAAQKVE